MWIHHPKLSIFVSYQKVSGRSQQNNSNPKSIHLSTRCAYTRISSSFCSFSLILREARDWIILHATLNWLHFTPWSRDPKYLPKTPQLPSGRIWSRNQLLLSANPGRSPPDPPSSTPCHSEFKLSAITVTWKSHFVPIILALDTLVMTGSSEKQITLKYHSVVITLTILTASSFVQKYMTVLTWNPQWEKMPSWIWEL